MMSDPEIVSALIARDTQVTAQFFYQDCRPLLLSIIHRVFDKQIVDYDEIINELYLHLMENDASRLRQFKYDSTLYQWIKVTSIRHCLQLKTRGRVIDNIAQEPLVSSDSEIDTLDATQAKMDIEALLSQMRNPRFVKVIRLLLLEDREPEEVALALGVTVDNLYNIKRRALSALLEVALKDKQNYDR